MFTNEPLTDFSVESNRNKMIEALQSLLSSINKGPLLAYPIINGEIIKDGPKNKRLDPSNTERVIGETVLADKSHVEKVFRSLESGVEDWANTKAAERADIFKKVAQRMRESKFALSALIICEAGKPWKEADADVAESIDFCNYYAEEIMKYADPIPTSNVPGEENFYSYQPRGISVIVSPWNFPLAIASGMTIASLVTGNAAILKPAGQTNVIAYEFAKLLLECGVPKNAFAFLPGPGGILGKELVEHPQTDMICFTGSMEVGLEIISTASKVVKGQKNIKKVIAELGGKNAIIVDESADLDDAIKGILYSAFGFSGQKCSACSRVIVISSIYEKFINRLKDATNDLIIGDAMEPSTFIGPVIDKAAQLRILNTIEKAQKESPITFTKSAPKSGHFVPPTIFCDVPLNGTLWNEEVFGPVIACVKATDMDEALVLAMNSQYALTGGLFSRNPKNIALAKEKFKVGNLYINRSCTGAMVARQPFGGLRMSGIGSKAGGPDYLLQFMEPRTITENTMRRGFAPEE